MAKIFLVFLLQLFLLKSVNAQYLLGFQYLYQFFNYDNRTNDELLIGADGSGLGISFGHKIGGNTFEIFTKYGKWTRLFELEGQRYNLETTDWMMALGFRQEIFSKSFYVKIGISMNDLRSKLNGLGGPSGDSFTEDLFTRMGEKKMAPYVGFGFLAEYIKSAPFMFDFNLYKFKKETLYELEFGLHIKFN